MSNISTYLADKLLDHAFGGSAYTQPTAYVGLFTTNPTMPAGTGGTEVSGGAYARQALSGSMAAAAAEAKSNNTAINFPQATADQGTITGVGIWDALSGGNLLAAGALAENKVNSNGDTFQIPSTDLAIALS